MIILKGSLVSPHIGNFDDVIVALSTILVEQGTNNLIFPISVYADVTALATGKKAIDVYYHSMPVEQLRPYPEAHALLGKILQDFAAQTPELQGMEKVTVPNPT